MRLLGPTLVFALVSMVACGGDQAGEPGEGGEPAADTTNGVSAGTASDTATGGAGTAVSGQAVFTANCATCHGATGRGDGPASVGLEPPPADLSDATWVTGDGSLPAIVNVVENGSPGTAMIGWKGTLSDAEIDAVARYVQSFGR
jgi:mono/diheme cytochrome c family protein